MNRLSLLRAGIVLVLLVLVWLILDGLDSLLTGLVAAVIGASLFVLLHVPRPYHLRIWRLPRFVLFFLVESVRGAVDVAWRAFHPALPIVPAMIDHGVELPAGQPRMLLVSVISLLPGTLSADLDSDGKMLKVHAISEDPDIAVRTLQAQIAYLYGLIGTPRP